MGVTKDVTIATMKEECIKEVTDLVEFDKDNLESVFEALRKLTGKFESGKLVPTQPHHISVKSKKHIQVAATAMRYYE